MNTSASERFWSRADRLSEHECWNWKGMTTDKGYGVFSLGARRQRARAHRFAYEMEVGPIPEGLVIDHLCRNTLCVNPAHLEAVTNRENILRGESPSAQAFREDRCGNGHPRSLANTRVTRAGKRQCRVCARDRARIRRGWSE